MGNVGKFALVYGNDARLEEMCSYFLDGFRDEWLVYLFDICASYFDAPPPSIISCLGSGIPINLHFLLLRDGGAAQTNIRRYIPPRHSEITPL